MKLLIGIATYNRIEKLDRCLRSIYESTHKDFEIVIVADNQDYYTQGHVNYIWGALKCLVQPEHKYVIGAWNRIVQENIHKDWDGFIGLCDDVELKPDALENIVKWHKSFFPDTDGVCGFNQQCPGHPNYTFQWFGQTLMGRKFIERYKETDYQICCPYYKWSHQDEEMYFFATSLNKFYKCKQANLYHYHPCFIKEEIDNTHKILRQGNDCPKNHDLSLFVKRQKENKIWGLTWEK